jgi:hypothetical protein
MPGAAKPRVYPYNRSYIGLVNSLVVERNHPEDATWPDPSSPSIDAQPEKESFQAKLPMIPNPQNS